MGYLDKARGLAARLTTLDPVIEYNRMTESENAEMDQFTLSHILIVSSRV